MARIKLDNRHLLSFINDEHIAAMESEAENARKRLLQKTGKGNDFIGWVDYLDHLADEEINRIIETSQAITASSDVLVVIGIGGSYLGAKAAIELLSPYFKSPKCEIIFAGHTLSATYASQLLTYLKNKKFSINVISKSGTTTEPAIAFRLLYRLLVEQHGKNADSFVYVTTDEKSGALRKLSNEKKYPSFVIPGNIGGRYSVLTAVGLLPIACAGIDIQSIIAGAKAASVYFRNEKFMSNEAMLYASIRNLLYRQGKRVELFAAYEPQMHYLSEWLKQLFGESEGKNHKGLFPVSVVYSTDLHSMGQYVQDGSRILFETIIAINEPKENIIIPYDSDNLDGLNFLAGKDVEYVNKQAMLGTILAHVDGGVPNVVIEIERLDAFHFGYLIYFFMFTCAISGYILDVNPFDQEGVEDYKRNMFALLGKPGFEDLHEVLKGKIK